MKIAFPRPHASVSRRLPLRFALVIGALGVVYGDIGTSPLYVVNQAFFGLGHLAVTRGNILGVIGLIFWLLTIVVSIEYVFVVLRANYQGEGGVFALHELLVGIKRRRTPILMMLLIFASTLLLGDGMITPAISVLSAVEGLKVATGLFEPYIIYIAAAILGGLFLLQRRGTAKVGILFGPVMILWFATIGALGLREIIHAPDVLHAVNPLYALQFAMHVGLHKLLLAIGAVTLAITGAESLYADLGHFGKRPIRQGWFYLAYWALVLNYLGQGAFLLAGKHTSGGNVFFSLLPHISAPSSLAHVLPAWAVTHLPYVPVYAMVALATAATIIASQALITGAFSLASQAMALGMMPRFNIIHTNRQQEGQIYVPAVNWLLLAGCLVLVFTFRSSSNLAAAYGLAVTGVMVATSSSMYEVARHRWSWRRLPANTVFRFFLAIDLTLFSANLLKFFTGGYVPVLVALMLFAFVMTWRWGRVFVHSAYDGYITYTQKKNMKWLLDVKYRLSKERELTDRPRRLVELDRAVVFLVSRTIKETTDDVPIILRIFMKQQGALPRYIVLLTIVQENVPFVKKSDRIEVTNFGTGVLGVQAHFGFMQSPNGLRVLQSLKEYYPIGANLHRCTVQAAEEELFIGKNARFIDKLRIHVYDFFSRLSPPAYHYFRLDTKPGLNKTNIPIVLGKEGWRIDIPEFALEGEEEHIDPDTRKPTDLRFVRT